MTVLKVYEIQNLYNGVIEEIYAENILLIQDNITKTPTLQQVINKSSILRNGAEIYTERGFGVRTNYNNNGVYNGFVIQPANPNFPNVQPLHSMGVGFGSTITEMSLNFYENRSTFKDTLFEKGLEYEEDYSANFTQESLVSLRYVSARIAAIEVKQKMITFPTNFPSNNYELLYDDNHKLFYIDNGTNNVTISIPTNLPAEFSSSFIPLGTGTVTFTFGGYFTVHSAVGGHTIKGAFYKATLDMVSNLTKRFVLSGDLI